MRPEPVSSHIWRVTLHGRPEKYYPIWSLPFASSSRGGGPLAPPSSGTMYSLCAIPMVWFASLCLPRSRQGQVRYMVPNRPQSMGLLAGKARQFERSLKRLGLQEAIEQS
jgi:hypothetical protein